MLALTSTRARLEPINTPGHHLYIWTSRLYTFSSTSSIEHWLYRIDCWPRTLHTDHNQPVLQNLHRGAAPAQFFPRIALLVHRDQQTLSLQQTTGSFPSLKLAIEFRHHLNLSTSTPSQHTNVEERTVMAAANHPGTIASLEADINCFISAIQQIDRAIADLSVLPPILDSPSPSGSKTYTSSGLNEDASTPKNDSSPFQTGTTPGANEDITTAAPTPAPSPESNDTSRDSPDIKMESPSPPATRTLEEELAAKINSTSRASRDMAMESPGPTKIWTVEDELLAQIHRNNVRVEIRAIRADWMKRGGEVMRRLEMWLDRWDIGTVEKVTLLGLTDRMAWYGVRMGGAEGR